MSDLNVTAVEANDLKLSLATATGTDIDPNEVEQVITSPAFLRIIERLAAERVAAADADAQQSRQVLASTLTELEQANATLAERNVLKAAGKPLAPTPDQIERGQDGARRVTTGAVVNVFGSRDYALLVKAQAEAAIEDWTTEAAEIAAARKARQALVERILAADGEEVPATTIDALLDRIKAAGLNVVVAA